MSTSTLVMPAPMSQRRALPERRLLMLDVAKLMAIFAIIWLHTPESDALKGSYSLGLFAVPFFTLSAAFLTILGLYTSPHRGFMQYAASRFARIYVPFLIWTVLYLVLIDARHLLLSRRPPLALQPVMLLAGSAHHLWFLPFILLACLFSFIVGKAVVGRAALEYATIIAAPLLGVALFFTPHAAEEHVLRWAGGFVYPLGRIVAALPSVFFGISAGILYRRVPSRFWTVSAVGLIGITINAAAEVALWRHPEDTFLPDPFDLLRHVGALGWLLLALMAWQGPLVQRLSRLGKCVFGIYIIHAAIIEGLQAVAARAGYRGIPWLDITVFICAATLATAAAAMLNTRRWGRWLVPT